MQCDCCGSEFGADSENAKTVQAAGSATREDSVIAYSTARTLCPACENPAPTSSKTLAIKSNDGAVGRFRIDRVCGRGAFGDVYEAWDPQLRRRVALKIPRTLTAGDTEAVIHEARAASSLKHPGIAAVLEVDTDGDVTFLVTEFIDGLNLRAWSDGQRIPPTKAVLLVTELADALAYAHSNGVVHRDLKPENVLVDQQGCAHIVDFGLAKSVNQSISISGEGSVMGSPSYMAPEQARGESHLADGRSDLYSLGVILYEMLTGEVPFRGSLTRVLRQVLEDEPVPPRHLVDTIPRDIESICLKCLAKEPDRRYQMASEFAEDLRSFVNGDRVNARPYNRIAKLAKWCQNTNRITEAGTYLLFFGIVLSLWAIAGFLGVAFRLRFPSQFTSTEIAVPTQELAAIPIGLVLYATIAWIGWRAMRRNLMALWTGLALLLALAMLCVSILVNVVMVPIGGMYSNDASTDPLFLLLLIITSIGSLSFGIALVAYYRNRNSIEWAAAGKKSILPSVNIRQVDNNVPGR